jgi:CBS domain-containing protein
MVVIERKNTLQNLSVSNAMRRQVVQLEQTKSIDHGINILIKFKVNALLTVDGENKPVGVVSKTDIMGAYYAGLVIDSPLEYIMVSPPLFCHSSDSLEAALELMRSHGVYRLYVLDSESEKLVGALAYPDIVGLLYQYCRQCEFNHLNILKHHGKNDSMRRFSVREVMTSQVRSIGRNEALSGVMEELSAHRFGAILVADDAGSPCGVISKTDLALTYKHGVDPQTPAHTVMSSPVHTCDVDLLLEEAIRKMILTDTHRLFVHEGDGGNIVGVLSLSDAARVRSGSCHGCVSSRIKVEDHD